MHRVCCWLIFVAATLGCSQSERAQTTGQTVVIGRDSVIIGHGDSVIFRGDSVIVGHGDTTKLNSVQVRRCHFEFTWYQPLDVHTIKAVYLECPRR